MVLDGRGPGGESFGSCSSKQEGQLRHCMGGHSKMDSWTQLDCHKLDCHIMSFGLGMKIGRPIIKWLPDAANQSVHFRNAIRREVSETLSPANPTI